MAKARKAFDEGIWPRLTIAERCDHVSKFLKAFAARMDDIDCVQALEAGMVITTAQGFSAWADMVGDDVVNTSKKIAEFEVRDVLGGQVEVRHEPVVAGVMPYDTFDEAIVIAAIPISVWPVRCSPQAMRLPMKSFVAVGSLQVNSSTVCLLAPYGGMKQSGYGRVGGVEGLLEVANIKTVQRTSVKS
ncbi:hypothetical protein CJ179_47135 [Rhodococcus sp. ACS1]|uniref:aldehyde dehydrogenase family protein n=1 Tax=Rhodococcus sp. ACS1 TaxID=2028570 RepID=UPI000BB11164|nr:aldehyde dehydrogenase family protein [Rhodococcus sp. ACS1]PBC35637.1 hypothetical protein CJ179_47135 [Rhodococcus sp. ACS1]